MKDINIIYSSQAHLHMQYLQISNSSTEQQIKVVLSFSRIIKFFTEKRIEIKKTII